MHCIRASYPKLMFMSVNSLLDKVSHATLRPNLLYVAIVLPGLML